MSYNRSLGNTANNISKIWQNIIIWIRWIHIEKYDLISFRAFPQIPTYISRIQNRWSIVSKAADKSSKTSKTPLPLPIVVTISLYTLNKAVSLLWPALCADWKLSIISLFFRWSCIWVAGSRPYFLIKGKMMENLQDVGKIPAVKQRFTIHRIISRIENRWAINNLVGNGSNTQVVLFNLRIRLHKTSQESGAPSRESTGVSD